MDREGYRVVFNEDDSTNGVCDLCHLPTEQCECEVMLGRETGVSHAVVLLLYHTQRARTLARISIRTFHGILASRP